MIISIWNNVSCHYESGRDSELLMLVLKTLEFDCHGFYINFRTYLTR